MSDYLVKYLSIGFADVEQQQAAAARIEELEATLTDIISEYDEPDNGRSLRWAIDAGRDVLKGYKDE